MKAFIEGVDLVGEEMSDGGSEDARELGMQEMAEGAAKGFPFARVVGLAIAGTLGVHVRPPFFRRFGRVFSWIRPRISRSRTRAEAWLRNSWYRRR